MPLLTTGAGAYPAAGGGGTPFSITYISQNSITTGGGSYVFTSQAIGTADATRIVAVCIAQFITNTITVTSVDIGGIAATQATGAASGAAGSSLTDIWYAAVPTGTTATITVNLSASQARLGILVYSVIGTGAAFSAAANANAAGANGTSLSASVTVPAGGGTIGVVGIHSSAPGAITPSNLTLDSNGSAGVVFGNSAMSSGLDTSHSGSTSFGFSWTTSIDAAFSVVTFTP